MSQGSILKNISGPDGFLLPSVDLGSVVTEATPTWVYEITQVATFENIFKSVDVHKDSLCLTPEQIELFVVSFSERLNVNNCATFFLFKSEGQFFVRDIRVRPPGCVDSSVYNISFYQRWRGIDRTRHYFVLPVLLPEAVKVSV